jgi:hypothetical protein
MQVEYSLLYKHNVNGIIERARGVLITRAIALKLSGGLPNNMSAEYWISFEPDSYKEN